MVSGFVLTHRRMVIQEANQDYLEFDQESTRPIEDLCVNA